MYIVPMQRFHVSVTERSGFQTCRRRWYLENHERLSPNGQVTWYFLFGDTIHSALDAFYQPISSSKRKPTRDIADALDAFYTAWDDKNKMLSEMYQGVFTLGIEEEWYEHKVRGTEMLMHYAKFDKAHPLFDTIIDIGVEDRGFVNILNPDGRDPVPGMPLLSGRVDIVAQKKDKKTIILDHKALASMAHDRSLDLDDQLTGYAYIWWRLTGDIVDELYYNVLVKDPPKPPRILADGKLSKDKSQRTTYDLYVAEIKNLGLNKIDYEEHLNFLIEKGWDQFFRRLGPVPKSEYELLSYESRVFYQYQDMEYALQKEAYRYPNPTQYTCPGCSVMSICKAMEEGDDAQWVKDTGYDILPPRVEIPPHIQSDKWEGV